MNELSEITGNEIEEDTTPTETSPPVAMETQPIPDVSPPKTEETILPTTTLNTVDLLKSRIEMYKLAEKIAKESGDTTRARSRGRGVKTLESMFKQALAGKTINPDEIPPVVSTKAPNSPPASNAPILTLSEAPQPAAQESLQPDPKPESNVPNLQDVGKATPAVNEAKINALLERQREYKLAALTAKKSGDTATALQFVKIAKIFDTVLASARNGEAVDLSDMPPPPNEIPSDMLKSVGQPQAPAPPLPTKQENTIQQATDENKINESNEKPAEPIQKPKPVEVPPPEVPQTILEALTQRLLKYQAVEANAKAEENDRKARQNGRIVKQYQDAIKAHKAGRTVVFDELPTPPGYPPIPVNDHAKPASAPAPSPAQAPAPARIPSLGPSGDQSPENSSPKRSPMKRQDSRVSGNHSNTTVMNKTIEILLERQRDFKEAALEAKKAGEMEQAKEFLKTFKGIDNLLNVARGGLPVDLSSLPISPKQREKLNDTFDMLSDSEDNATNSADLKDVYDRLEKQLTKQLEKCKNWR